MDAVSSLNQTCASLRLVYAWLLKISADVCVCVCVYALSMPRRVAVPLLPKVKQEIKRMVKVGVITEVIDPTDWCAGMVVVPKPSGKVRICVDLTKLSVNVCREQHVLPFVETILAQLGGAKHFSNWMPTVYFSR